MIFFALILIMLMILIGGMAIDFVCYEYDRARIQATADTAALAAASMRRTGEAELEAPVIVADWFAKAGLADALEDTQGIGNMNSRDVRILTRTTTRPFFLNMLGVDELTSPGAGRAIEARTNVEISLVLDISGSMLDPIPRSPNRQTKMEGLQDAAKEFVNTMLEGNSENRVSISLVPYSGQVNLGPDLMGQYNITDRHTNSYCVDLPTTAYSSLVLSPTTPIPQNAHADTYNSASDTTSWSNSNMAPASNNRWCMNNSNNEIRVLSNDAETLGNQIDSLEAVGATSIDAGLRWGAALLDPGSRSVVTGMTRITKRVGRGSSARDVPLVDPEFDGRPFDYDDRDTTKVIVLMTDGSHWPNEFVAEGYRSGPSPIFRHSDGNYSIHHPTRSGSAKYWVPHRSEWRQAPWAGTSCSAMSCVPAASRAALDWQTVWQNLRVQWVANQLYRRPLGISFNAAVNRLRTREGVTNSSGNHDVRIMDTRINDLCTLLKNQGVLVFGIAFAAPDAGATVIRNCASPNRYYPVTEVQDLNGVFRDISRQIISLRLVQ